MHNRKFKFRVWDIINLEFNYSDSRQFLIGLNGLVYDGNGSLYDESHIIQQFTGLKDKNGKEIYEGDIIKYDTKRNYKRFDIFPVQWSLVQGGGFNCLTFFHPPLGEIIGNIFENSELLEN